MLPGFILQSTLSDDFDAEGFLEDVTLVLP